MGIFVAGATGQTGRHIVRQLIDKNVSVRALVRNLEQATEILPPEAELIVGDILKPETIVDALNDCNVLLCATGASPSLDPTGPFQVDYQGTKNLVDLAKEKEIELIVMGTVCRTVLVSSLCVSKFFHPLNLFWLVLYWKKQAEEYLQQSSLTYTIVRPGGLKNENNSDNIVMSSADTLFEGSIPRPKVAQVCVEALTQPAAKSKIVEIVAKPEATNKNWEQLFAGIT